MNKEVKNAIGWILYLALLVGLVLGVPRGLGYFLETDYPIASITSGSMWPELKKGDLVLIKGVTNKDEIEIGDIVVYRNPNGFTIHRVIKLNENTIVTKGDANNVEDNPVGYEEIIGKTLTFNQKIVKIPFLGNVRLLINRNKT